MSQTELLHLLVSLTLLLFVVHIMGRAAERLRQPRVAGEILGGLLLGPTVSGAVVPGLQHALFPAAGPVAGALGGVEQLGLLMLMFLAGSETRRVARRDLRLISNVVAVGLVVPFGAGLLVAYRLDLASFAGPADSRAALGLVVASAIAVTSIPVISRIMLDLGILGTSFAGVVLSTAVVEDVVLYTVLAVSLGLARAPGEAATGLPHLLGLDTGTLSAGAYHGLIVLVLFGGVLRLGPALGRRLARGLPADDRPATAAIRCVLLVLAGAAAAAALGVQPMFGAFLAGVVVAEQDGGRQALCSSCRTFSLAFFLPVYFGSVGLKLDLVHHFQLVLTVGIVALACLVKIASVYAGARLAGEPSGPAVHLAMALNARGGPGIALATLTFDAGIIDQTLFTALVILAVGTSLLAAGWLRRAVSRGLPLRGEPEPVRSPGPVDRR
ncbi:MAG TPA: cation:proton antiporter [Mycobacteriales bacterium]